MKQRMNSRRKRKKKRKRKEKKRKNKKERALGFVGRLSVEAFSLRLSFLVYKIGKYNFFGGVL